MFDYIKDGEELVNEPFQRLIKKRELVAYKYDGFWASLDTYKDKRDLDEMFSVEMAHGKYGKTKITFGERTMLKA